MNRIAEESKSAQKTQQIRERYLLARLVQRGELVRVVERKDAFYKSASKNMDDSKSELHSSKNHPNPSKSGRREREGAVARDGRRRSCRPDMPRHHRAPAGPQAC
jgi:hypothetical protein